MEIKFEHYRLPENVGTFSKIVKLDKYFIKLLSERYGRKNKQFKPHPRGGVTICYVTENGETKKGTSICSIKDNFCYALGRKIAFGRAIKGE